MKKLIITKAVLLIFLLTGCYEEVLSSPTVTFISSTYDKDNDATFCVTYTSVDTYNAALDAPNYSIELHTINEEQEDNTPLNTTLVESIYIIMNTEDEEEVCFENLLPSTEYYTFVSGQYYNSSKEKTHNLVTTRFTFRYIKLDSEGNIAREY